MSNIYINIEGTDGCGKQTQSNKLLEFLKAEGYKVMIQSFPNYNSLSSGPVKMYLGGDLGDSVYSLDQYQASTLYASDRLCTIKMLEKEFDNGIVILDRYVGSNKIHQAGKIKDLEEREKYLMWVDDFEYNVLKLPRPAITLFLDMPVEKSIELAHARKDLKSNTKTDVFEKDENHLKDAYNNGLNVAKKFGWKIIRCVDDENNLKAIDSIHEEIKNQIHEIINKD